MSHANQGQKGVKNHVVVTPFIENGFSTFSEPRSGAPCHSYAVSISFSSDSINPEFRRDHYVAL